ncbi:hypothetical protein C8R46DRAFT_1087671 [Mycena filopes]|nr:hypothetical protein C8R46DRAFT_1087671 [Mycena filopes]
MLRRVKVLNPPSPQPTPTTIPALRTSFASLNATQLELSSSRVSSPDMTTIHHSRPNPAETAKDYDDAEAFLQTCIPLELDLGALELEFDNQLTSVIDNLFGHEFSSLQGLEGFVTTTTTTSAAGPSDYKGKSKQVTDGLEDIESAVAVYKPATRAGGFAHSPPKPTDSGSASLDEDGVVVRSTQRPAPLPSSNSGEGEIITRATAAPVPSVHQGFAEQVVPPPKAPIRTQPPAPITPTPQPAERHVFVSNRMASFTMPPAPSATGAFVRDDIPMSGVSLSSIAIQNPPFAAPLAPPPAFQSFTRAIEEDVEMPFSDAYSPPDIYPGISFQPMQSHGFAAQGASHQNPPPPYWMTGNQQLFSSSSATAVPCPTPDMWSEPHRVPDFTPRLPFLPPGLPAPAPHPSIFELIRTDPRNSTTTPYLIPPVNLPMHVWQQEITRDSQRTLANREKPAKRGRIPAPYFFRTPLVLLTNKRRGKKKVASRLSSFGSLDVKSHPPPDKYGDTGMDTAKPPIGIVYPPHQYDRSSSPTPSCSSSPSCSAVSLPPTAASRAYVRKLSSPPPFGTRHKRFSVAPKEHRGVLGVLRSAAWPWS